MAGNPNIISLEEFDESINMLVYGKSGSGKTVFGGTADNVLFLGVESGTVSAKRQGSKADLWPINTWEDIEEAYTWLHDNPDHGYDWIVLDSLTQMQQMLLRWILLNAVAENGSRDPDIPTLYDHQKWQNMFKRFVLAFCDLPANVLFTALVRNEQDEEGEDFLTPDIQGKGYQISQYVCGMMSCYGYLQVKRKKDKETGKVQKARRITWQDTGIIQGKDRYDVLAPYTDDATLQELFEKIKEPVILEDPPKKTSAKQSSKKATTEEQE